MKITRSRFGLLADGREVFLYVLKAGDLRLCLSSLGASWTSLRVPSSRGGRGEVLLGYGGLEGYLADTAFMGATPGRFANRIAGSRFTIEGRECVTDANEGRNTLHGGRAGFSGRLWKSEAYEEGDGIFVRFELKSGDGDCGFPGNLRARVTYGLTKAGEVTAFYRAKCDEPTPVNLTNHAYFNLAGDGGPPITGHALALNCSSYLEVDAEAIPTGRLLPVKGGPFDFREGKEIGRDLTEAEGGLTGYDHCFTVDGDPGRLRPCAAVSEESSGRTMRVFTTQPGVQFYTGDKLGGIKGRNGVYSRHSGFCLETQHFPDAPNRPDFPQAVCGPGRVYEERAVFSFEIA